MAMGYLESTDDIIADAKTALDAIVGTEGDDKADPPVPDVPLFNSVEVFKGTSERELFEGFLQEAVNTPSAVILYGGSTLRQGTPRRKLDLTVLVTTEPGKDQTDVWTLVEKVVLALDDLRSGDAVFFATGDRSLDIGGGAACSAVSFEVRDH